MQCILVKFFIWLLCGIPLFFWLPKHPSSKVLVIVIVIIIVGYAMWQGKLLYGWQHIANRWVLELHFTSGLVFWFLKLWAMFMIFFNIYGSCLYCCPFFNSPTSLLQECLLLLLLLLLHAIDVTRPTFIQLTVDSWYYSW